MSSKYQQLAPVDSYEAAAVESVPSILDQRSTARKFRINLGAYEQSRIITGAERSCVQAFIETSSRTQVLDTNGAECVRIILTLAHKLTQSEPVQYIITLLDDLLEAEPERVALFKPSGDMAVDVLLRVITSKAGSDPFLAHMCARVVAKLLLASLPASSVEIRNYLSFIHRALRANESDGRLLGLSYLQKLVRVEAYRELVFQSRELTNLLREILREDTVAHAQLHYHTVHCFWILTFTPGIAGCLEKSLANIVGELAAVLRGARKEKVIRVCLATLRNMVEKPTEEEDREVNATAMISHKVHQYVRVVLSHNPDDEEMRADGEYLDEYLNEFHERMSTFDEYASEISGGQLEWSPVHRSERFWRENSTRLNENNHKLLKTLVHLLQNSRDPVVIAVAAHDCGEYVRHYPRGKMVLERLGGKGAIMQYMHHPDQSVRYETLLAVQKIMTQNWGILGEQLAQSAGKNNS